MDYEAWIRAQLGTPPRRSTLSRSTRRAPRFSGRIAAAIQVLVAAAALTLIVTGLTSIGSLSALPTAVLIPSERSLPVDTWAGAPPPPTRPAKDDVTDSPQGSATSSGANSATPSNRATTASGSERSTPRAAPTPSEDGGGPRPSSPSSGAGGSAAFNLRGGTVSASCRGAQIQIDSASPRPGFDKEVEAKSSGSVIEVRFRSDSSESELRVWCTAGQVQSQVREGAS